MSRARARTNHQAKLSSERVYEVIRRPIVTEKSTLGSEHNQVTFEVALGASKPEIKAAVEALFKVKVKGDQHPAPQGQGQALPQPRRQALRQEERRT